MFYKLCRAMKDNKKGFTLVELMVVVVIIGVLVAIAVPVFQNVTKTANQRAVEGNLRTIDGAISMYRANNPTGTIASGGTELHGGYIQTWPTGPDKVTYQVIGDGTTGAPYKAQVTKHNDTGAWFPGTAGSATLSLPITTWP